MKIPFFRTVLCGVLSVVMLLAVCNVHAQSAQANLSQYIADLKENPDDTALREKIIKHVQAMRPAPVIPEEVDELVGQAKYAFKHAQTQADYQGAVEAYRKIVNIAPWVGDYYYNLGVAQEQAGRNQDAITSFKLYLLATPEAKDAKEVRERIGGLKYALAKAAEESSPEAVAAKKQDEYEAWLKKIDGRSYWYRDLFGNTKRLDIKGRTLVWLAPGTSSPEWGRFEIKGREFTCRSTLRSDEEFTFIISPDGASITQRVFRSSDGARGEFVFVWP